MVFRHLSQLNLQLVLRSKKKLLTMKTRILHIVLLFLCCLSCNTEDDQIQNPDTQGKNMLLIGNSFFKPYAQNLDALVVNAGIDGHTSTLIFRGGENGRPINFWNDSDSPEHQQIKSTLERGNVDFFGMTAGLLPENPIDGFKQWIDYAMEHNPDVVIFLSIPSIDFPENWDQLAEDNGFSSIHELYHSFVNHTIHAVLVDQLRAEFPSTQIFTIPTGWATINLAQMHLDNELLDDIAMFGPKPTSIFTDTKGHQGQIAIETGTLIWLNSLYKIDLESNRYNTGFNTDLHALAKTIMDEHDSNYKQ